MTQLVDKVFRRPHSSKFSEFVAFKPPVIPRNESSGEHCLSPGQASLPLFSRGKLGFPPQSVFLQHLASHASGTLRGGSKEGNHPNGSFP